MRSALKGKKISERVFFTKEGSLRFKRLFFYCSTYCTSTRSLKKMGTVGGGKTIRLLVAAYTNLIKDAETISPK